MRHSSPPLLPAFPFLAWNFTIFTTLHGENYSKNYKMLENIKHHFSTITSVAKWTPACVFVSTLYNWIFFPKILIFLPLKIYCDWHVQDSDFWSLNLRFIQNFLIFNVLVLQHVIFVFSRRVLIGWIFKTKLTARVMIKKSEKISSSKMKDDQGIMKISRRDSVVFRIFYVEVSLKNSNFIKTTVI